MYDTIIIGAGPAGLTAAIYLKRANKKVLVLEAMSYGGQIINAASIENYPGFKSISGFLFATNLYNQVKELGAEIKFEKALNIIPGDIKKVITSNNEYETKTIIIATGSDSRKLGLENEEKLIGKGVSYCATCDGAFYKNKTVAVVGGGDTAVDDAIYLSNIVSKVYLIHRRDTFKKDITELTKKPNVEIIVNSNIQGLNGVDKLESITIKDKENNIKTLSIDGLFIAVGRIPENENFSKLITLDDKGYVIAKEDCHTNIEGIFVAGDNRTKNLRQLVTATSDGGVSATEAIKYINNTSDN